MKVKKLLTEKKSHWCLRSRYTIRALLLSELRVLMVGILDLCICIYAKVILNAVVDTLLTWNFLFQVDLIRFGEDRFMLVESKDRI